MVASMKTVASLDVELTVEERNLLSVAYKNVIGARRASWRIISSIEQKEENKAAEDKLKMIKTYRTQVWILTFWLVWYQKSLFNFLKNIYVYNIIYLALGWTRVEGYLQRHFTSFGQTSYSMFRYWWI